jgi:hypothetical protein
MTRLTSALLALLGHASVEATTRGDPPANLPIGYKLRYLYSIIPPRILARADEVIEGRLALYRSNGRTK